MKEINLIETTYELSPYISTRFDIAPDGLSGLFHTITINKVNQFECEDGDIDYEVIELFQLMGKKEGEGLHLYIIHLQEEADRLVNEDEIEGLIEKALEHLKNSIEEE